MSESSSSQVFRAERLDDGLAVYLKTAPGPRPSPDRLTMLCHEYRISTRLQGRTGVIATHGLERDGARLALVTEDFGGLALDRALSLEPESPSVPTLLAIALGAARALEQVHQAGILHKDISPANLIWNPRTGQLKLLDFGISTTLTSENLGATDPGQLEGTLAYMAPEQTGRMNRSLDQRGDLYGLGATLYRVMTGQPPFKASDPLELVHSHLARSPRPPHLVRSDLPVAVSEIILKLMAKDCEDRYQTAGGLIEDLEHCLAQLESHGAIERFALGTSEGQSFFVPQRLYGRERASQSLLEAFSKAANGKPIVVMLSGQAGVGKSALVAQLQRANEAPRGYFFAGKCEQLNQDIPYFGLSQLLRAAARQLLSQPSERLQWWRERLNRVLDTLGSLLVSLAPEFQAVLGPQATPAELPPRENQYRLDSLLTRLLQELANPEHPVTLFLDDLQWVDESSLRVLARALADSETGHVLWLGAYRTHEVNPSHPLPATLHALEKTVEVRQFEVEPLQAAQVAALVADATRRPAEEVTDLTELCMVLTLGNPFFLHQLLETLHEVGGLRCVPGQSSWSYHPETVERLGLSDDVAALIATNLGKLPAETQSLLQWAACLGASFGLLALATVSQQPPMVVVKALWPALEKGFVLPVGEDYKFLEDDPGGRLGAPERIHFRWLHDRVQQGAYRLVASPTLAERHHRVAERLLELPPEEQEERLFDIVRHLNLGRACVDTTEQHQLLVRLNLTAGQRAARSAAYAQARGFLEVGLAQMGPGAWSHDYELMHEFHCQLCNVTMLLADMAGLQNYFETTLEHARCPLDRVPPYLSLLDAHMAAGDTRAAVVAALEILASLGFDFSGPRKTPAQLRMAVEAACGQRSVESLAGLPIDTDPLSRAAVELMVKALAPAYVGAPDLFPELAVRAVCHCLERGRSPASCYAFATYGLLLAGLFVEPREARQWGELAMATLEGGGPNRYAPGATYVYHVHIRVWTEPLEGVLESNAATYRLALRHGDRSFAAFAILMKVQHGFFVGRALDRLVAECRPFLDTCAQLAPVVGVCARASFQMLLGLQGHTEDPCSLSGPLFKEEEALALYTQTGGAFAIASLHLYKAILFYLWRDYPAAAQQLQAITPVVRAFTATYHQALLCFYSALIEMATSQELTPTIEGALKRMAVWAQSCPTSFEHKRLLLEGEAARLRGDILSARRFLRAGIRGAANQSFMQEEALGWELLGQSFLAGDERETALTALRQARQLYSLWGAQAKVRQLNEEFADLGTADETSSSGTLRGSLDLGTLMKINEAISSEMQREGLLRTATAALLENAGATLATLLVASGHVLRPESWVRVGTEVELAQAASVPPELPWSILAYVSRTQAPVILDQVDRGSRFGQDPYFELHYVPSVLCLAAAGHDQTVCLYLENNLTPRAFDQGRVALLEMVLGQLVVSLENARLYGQLESVVEQRTRELERALEARSTFLASMSHEIRNPLNAIVGLTELCLRCHPPPPCSDYLAQLRSSTSVLQLLLDDILDFSRLEADMVTLVHEPFDLREVLERVRDVLKELARSRHLKLSVELDPNVPPHLVGDPGRISQILLNLTGNAIKFTQQGRVVVRVSGTQRAGAVAQVRFEVKDTGAGIAPEEQRRLFDAFYQGGASRKAGQGGTGLGLAICQRLATLMGSKLRVESAQGRGSRFYFELLLPVETLDATPLPQPQAELEGCILVVEDDPTNRMVISKLLEGPRLAIVEADSGEAALALLRGGLEPDCVLMDLQMPGIGGLETTRRLRALGTHNDLPILALTADAFTDTRDRCLESGMNDFITKPVRLDDLLSKLARWVHPPGNQEKTDHPNSQLDGIDFDDLLDRLGGRVEAARSVLKTFRASTSPLSGQLRQAWRAGRLEELGRLAHRLRGSSGNVSATFLYHRLGALQQVLETDQRSSIEAAVEAVEKELEAVLLSCQTLE